MNNTSKCLFFNAFGASIKLLALVHFKTSADKLLHIILMLVTLYNFLSSEIKEIINSKKDKQSYYK